MNKIAKTKIIWGLIKPLSNLTMNEKVVVKPVGRSQLTEVGKSSVGAAAGI